MTLIRVVHDKNNPYLTINTTIATDPSISQKAKGIWFYAFSRPNDWKFYVKEMQKHCKDGIDAIYSGLKELEKAEYLHREPIKDKKGRFLSHEMIFFETPEQFRKYKLNKNLLLRDFPLVDVSHVADPMLLSNDLPSIEENNNNPPTPQGHVFPKEAVVVSSKNNTERQREPKTRRAILRCLKDLKMLKSEKEWVTDRYGHDEPKVEKVVAYATSPTTVIRTTLQQTIKWGLSREEPPEPTVSKESQMEYNIKFSEQLSKEFLENPMNARFEVCKSYVQIGLDPNMDIISFSKSSFIQEIHKSLDKWKFILQISS